MIERAELPVQRKRTLKEVGMAGLWIVGVRCDVTEVLQAEERHLPAISGEVTSSPSLPVPRALSAKHAFVPRTGNRERHARCLDVDEQPSAVRSERGAGEFVVAEITRTNRLGIV